MRDFGFRAWTTGMLMALAPAVAAVQEIDLGLALLIVLPVAAIHRAARESARNEYLATHAALTGMPNRFVFAQRLEQALAGDAPAAILLMDLYRFKEITSTLGHPQGDALLSAMRPKLEPVVGSRRLFARLG